MSKYVENVNTYLSQMKIKQAFAMKLIDLIENNDEVLGAKSRFIKAIME